MRPQVSNFAKGAFSRSHSPTIAFVRTLRANPAGAHTVYCTLRSAVQQIVQGESPLKQNMGPTLPNPLTKTRFRYF